MVIVCPRDMRASELLKELQIDMKLDQFLHAKNAIDEGFNRDTAFFDAPVKPKTPGNGYRKVEDLVKFTPPQVTVNTSAANVVTDAVFTNLELIFSKYCPLVNESDRNFDQSDPLIKEGTMLFIPPYMKQRKSYEVKQQKLIDPASMRGFIASRLLDLMNDFGQTQTLSRDEKVLNTQQFVYLKCLIWSRISNVFIDVTDDVLEANTNIDGGGGNFTIALAHTKPFTNDKLKFIDLAYTKYSNIMENDLVYIKFGADYTVDMERAGDQIWDMIGLVDTVNYATTPNDYEFTIMGRDFIKVFIEDGSMFSPAQFLAGVFSRHLSTSTLAARNVFTVYEQIALLKIMSFTRLELVLEYIFDKFANIGIIPDDVILEQYGNLAAKSTDSYFEIPGGFSPVKELRELRENILRSRNGIWRIINLCVEEETGNRTIFDPTLCQDNGAMINSLKSLCQSPFVEFYGDTYGSQYYCVVRKQPFDFRGYTTLLYGNPSTELGQQQQPPLVGLKNTLSILTTEIDEEEVQAANLNWHQEVYTWYSLEPTCITNLNEKLNGLYLPCVLLDEYAAVWGNRPYNAAHDYVVFDIQDENTGEYNKQAFAQLFLDLKFLVESHAYLPFTRMGTIVIRLNRAIKRGLFVYFKPTNEVYYVDGVSHQVTVNEAVTILRVSRGMVLDYIIGKEEIVPDGQVRGGIDGFGKEKLEAESGTDNSMTYVNKNQLMSYFNIIDMPKVTSNIIHESLSDWRVNKDVFNFFLKRRQMLK